MEKYKIKNIINKTDDTYIYIDNKLIIYDLLSANIYQYFDIDQLLSKPDKLKSLVDQEYYYYYYIKHKEESNDKETPLTSKNIGGYIKKEVPLTADFLIEFRQEELRKELLSYEELENKNLNLSEIPFKLYKAEQEIELAKKIIQEDIQSFYDFSIEVEIEGIRTPFSTSQVFTDSIYLLTPDDISLKQKMDRLFGPPDIVAKREGEKDQDIHREYRVSFSRIDKIIGTKKFRDKTTLGEDEDYTGETEEIILDLYHFDQEIYNIFYEHGILEIDKN